MCKDDQLKKLKNDSTLEENTKEDGKTQKRIQIMQAMAVGQLDKRINSQL